MSRLFSCRTSSRTLKSRYRPLKEQDEFQLSRGHHLCINYTIWGRLFCSACEASPCPNSLLLVWRLSLISLYVAYTWIKPVNSFCPSRNLQSVCLCASALFASCSHLAPFPFTLGEFWISCPVWTIETHTFSYAWYVIPKGARIAVYSLFHPFHKRFRYRPHSSRCGLTVPCFCFPPSECLSTDHSSDGFGNPIKCRFTCWIPAYLPQFT
jgi:hypothetical protein